MNPDIDTVRVSACPDGRLDTKNAALYLGLSSKTLAMWRSAGTGPRFVKRGRVFYFLDDLKAWLEEQPKVSSTAQARLSRVPSTQMNRDRLEKIKADCEYALASLPRSNTFAATCLELAEEVERLRALQKSQHGGQEGQANKF